MKALLLGSDGFLGRHFFKHLIKLGYQITCVDIKSGIDAREFFKQNETQYDLVIHLAAIVGGRNLFENKPWELFSNFELDSGFLQWCLKANPKKIITFSSSAAYPHELQLEGSSHKLVESDIDLLNIKNPDPSIYGWSKLNLEVLVDHSRKAGLEVYLFRPFSGYGEDQGLDYPFCSFVDRVIKRENPFNIWGPGSQVRDFIHVDDIVNAAITAIHTVKPDNYNLCTGIPTSFNDLAELVIKYKSDYAPEIKRQLDKPVGVYYRVGEPSKMLGFYKPKISLEEGIERSFWRLDRGRNS